jgi:hypothetical protein
MGQPGSKKPPRGHLQPTQHALPRIDGIVHRVQANVAVAAHELNLDHHQVVDMVQVLADDVLGMPIVVPLEHQVAACAHTNLVRDVARKNELAVAPLDLDLLTMLTTIRSDVMV